MNRTFIIGKDSFPECFTLGASEHLDVTLVVLPGTSELVRSRIVLDGEGASLNLRALLVLGGTDDVSLDITVEHAKGGGTSKQLVRGIVADSARARFDGLVKVCPNAGKSDASQLCNSILLSRKAIFTVQPQLEIYNDDVLCSHGATTGFLNEQELYYLRSRGIPEEEARRLLLLSFLSPVLETLDDNLKETVASLL